METGIKRKRKKEKKNVHTVWEGREKEREFVDCRGIRLKGNEGRGMKKKEWFRARDRNNVKERGGGERGRHVVARVAGMGVKRWLE